MDTRIVVTPSLMVVQHSNGITIKYIVDTTFTEYSTQVIRTIKGMIPKPQTDDSKKPGYIYTYTSRPSISSNIVSADFYNFGLWEFGRNA